MVGEGAANGVGEDFMGFDPLLLQLILSLLFSSIYCVQNKNAAFSLFPLLLLR